MDEMKLCSPIHSTSEALVMNHVVGSCRGEELGPFCGPIPAAGVAVFSVSHQFAEHTSQMEWFPRDSESCSGSDGQQTSNVTVTLFWGKCDLGKCSGASSRSNH